MSNLPKVSAQVHEMIDSQLVLSNDVLREVMVKFEREVKKGLKKEFHDTAEIKCFVTYVQDLPNGREKGKVKIVFFKFFQIKKLVLVSSS